MSRNERWRLRAVAAAGLTSLLAACAVAHFQAPAITPTAVELMDVQILEQRFRVHLHVQNPNDQALPIKSVDCTLQVAGIEVGQGVSAGAFTVPAHGESDVEMIVTTNLATSMPNLLVRLSHGHDLPEYRLSGRVNPDIHLLPAIPFEKTGQIKPP